MTCMHVIMWNYAWWGGKCNNGTNVKKYPTSNKNEFLWCLKWRYSFGRLYSIVVKCWDNVTTFNNYTVQTPKRRPSSNDRNSLLHTLPTMLPNMSQNKLLVYLSLDSHHGHPSIIMSYHITFLLQWVNLEQHTHAKSRDWIIFTPLWANISSKLHNKNFSTTSWYHSQHLSRRQ